MFGSTLMNVDLGIEKFLRWKQSYLSLVLKLEKNPQFCILFTEFHPKQFIFLIDCLNSLYYSCYHCIITLSQPRRLYHGGSPQMLAKKPKACPTVHTAKQENWSENVVKIVSGLNCKERPGWVRFVLSMLYNDIYM